MLAVKGGIIFALFLYSYLVAESAAFQVEASEDNSVFPRERRMKLCGNNLYQMLRVICNTPMMRQRRHAVPEPLYPGQLSPFLMSVYRPKIDDDEMTITDGNWEMESSPTRDRFAHIGLLRRLNKRSPSPADSGWGISDTCCRKSCTWDELSRFCA